MEFNMEFNKECCHFDKRKIDWIDFIVGKYSVKDHNKEYPYCEFFRLPLIESTHDCILCDSKKSAERWLKECSSLYVVRVGEKNERKKDNRKE